jgi:hypothetical protein
VCAVGAFTREAFDHHRFMTRLRPADEGEAEEENSANEQKNHEQEGGITLAANTSGRQIVPALFLRSARRRDWMAA